MCYRFHHLSPWSLVPFPTNFVVLTTTERCLINVKTILKVLLSDPKNTWWLFSWWLHLDPLKSKDIYQVFLFQKQVFVQTCLRIFQNPLLNSKSPLGIFKYLPCQKTRLTHKKVYSIKFINGQDIYKTRQYWWLV